VEEEKKKAPVENTISLAVDVKFTTIAPMTVEEKRESRKKLVFLFPEFSPVCRADFCLLGFAPLIKKRL
jgi:hypothetical protein